VEDYHDDRTGNSAENAEQDIYKRVGDLGPSKTPHDIEQVHEEEDQETQDGVDDKFRDVFEKEEECYCDENSRNQDRNINIHA